LDAIAGVAPSPLLPRVDSEYQEALMDAFFKDLRYGVRLLAKRPGLTFAFVPWS
jgi:hypothetical protein